MSIAISEPAPRLWNKPSLRLEEIVVDPDVQSRAVLDEATIELYAEALRDPDQAHRFPASTVFYDEARKVYLLADGFHRHEAYRRLAWKSTIKVNVIAGTKRDARIFAAGANTTHGLNRTNADKRRAVQMLLDDEEWRQKSDRAIAEHCRVSNHLVAEVRASTGRIPSSDEKRIGKDGKGRSREHWRNQLGRTCLDWGSGSARVGRDIATSSALPKLRTRPSKRRRRLCKLPRTKHPCRRHSRIRDGAGREGRAVAPVGRPERNEEKGDVVTIIERGSNGSDYLTARIARDNPEIDDPCPAGDDHGADDVMADERDTVVTVCAELIELAQQMKAANKALRKKLSWLDKYRGNDGVPEWHWHIETAKRELKPVYGLNEVIEAVGKVKKKAAAEVTPA